MKSRFVGALAGAGLGLAMLATGVPAASAAPTLTQTYTCAVTGFGNISASAVVTGKAAKKGTKINLSKVVFKVSNPLGSPVTVNSIKVSVPDPPAANAPYVAGSAKVAASPAGWTAGHDATGVFAFFAGSQTIPGSGTVANAALSAKYTNLGPAGTGIKFVAGQVSFNVTSPLTATATCTPTAPINPFAMVKE